MPKIKCEVCKTDFSISPSRIGRIKCCSKMCSNQLKKITMTGDKNPFYGKKHTPETNMLNSRAHLGQRAWNKGKNNVYSAETIKNISDSLTGNLNAFKGGKRYRKGYVAIYSPNHPYKDKNKCIYEHRLIMEEQIGRHLLTGEVIHHLNGNKSDNRIENLKLFLSHKEHMLYHSKLGTITGRPKKMR